MVTKVDCPYCGKRTVYGPQNPWRPFCSERCKTGDLGAWASNAYVIGGKADDDEAASSEDESTGSGRPEH